MRKLTVILAALVFVSLVAAQDEWIMLEEYASPGEGARGLYYDGKVLWNVDNESETVFTLNPYNLEVIDIFASPVDQPWGITYRTHNFWMTNFGWDTSQLVMISADTFIVEVEYNFPDYYFYGLTCDSLTQHLWISVMTHGYTKYLMEFDPDIGEVVAWHPTGGYWPLGLQYHYEEIWTNSSDWSYPDYTYLYDIETGNTNDMYTCPLAVPEGIATNDVVWWISHFRDNAPYIWKLVPPGQVVHDICWFSPQDPPSSGTLEYLNLTPRAQFMNYGMFAENEVPFFCKIIDVEAAEEVYYDSVIHDTIEPEEVISITYTPIFLAPNTVYDVIFYGDLITDDYRENDTLKVYITTTITGDFHDIAINAILEPDENEPLDLIEPVIIAQNTGEFVEYSIPFSLNILCPGDSTVELHAVCELLEVNESDTIFFNTFNPWVEGSYTFIFDGELPGDVIPSNDLCSIDTWIGAYHDVSPVEIISPPDLVNLEPFVPVVKVANLGSYDEGSFNISCTVENSEIEVYSQEVNCPMLLYGSEIQMEFPIFTPQNTGLHSLTFTTLLEVDNIPENDTILIVTDIVLSSSPDIMNLPNQFQVDGAYPNPFNASTSILLSLPKLSQVTQKLYNLNGQVVFSRQYGMLPAGIHHLSLSAAGFPSGIYLLQTQTEEFIDQRKVVLLK
ncbi:MAG: T9SS type A sorting domain-containing protein [bacterium]